MRGIPDMIVKQYTRNLKYIDDNTIISPGLDEYSDGSVRSA